MSSVLFSPAAQADLLQIRDYTIERWGTAQAERYLLAIRDACRELADGRRQGRSAEAVRPGYKKAAVGSHTVFFRLTDAGDLAVIRILHQRMDVDERL